MKKKYLAVLLATGMVLSMSGCKDKNTEDAKEKTTQTSQDGTEKTDGSTDSDAVINPAEPTVAIEMQDKLADYVTLGEYVGMKYGVYSTEVTDKEIDDELRSECAANEYFEEVDKVAENGDFVYISFTGTIDGESDDNLSSGTDEDGNPATTSLELGSGSFIEGFEDGLVGHKAGDEVVLDLTFPDDYSNTDYASKNAQFTVNIASVNIIPEFTDEFIASTFGKTDEDSEESTDTSDKWTTVAQARESIKATLQESKESNKETYKLQDIVSKLIDDAKYTELPKAYVDEYYNASINDYTTYASYYSMEIEEFVEAYFGTTYDVFLEQVQAYAEECVREDLAMWKVAEEQNIVLTDEEYDSRCNELFESYKDSYGYTDVSKFVENNGGEDTVKFRLRLILAREWLAAQAVEGDTYTDRDSYTETLPWYNTDAE